MRTIKGVVTLAVALCALGGLAAGSAVAAAYRVENKTITKTVESALTSGASELKGEFLGGRVELAIKSQKSAGSFDLESGGLAKATINLEGNALYEINEKGEYTLISNCGVPTFAIGAKAELSVFNGKLASAFAPEDSVFADFSITGASCGLRKTDNYLTGTMIGIVPEAEVSKGTHLVSFIPSEAKSQNLSVYGSPAELTSTESLSLNGANLGKRWSAVSGSSPEESPKHAFYTEGEPVSTPVGVAGARGTTTIAGTLLADRVAIKCTGGSSSGTLEGSGLSATESSLTGCSLSEVNEGKETELPKCTVGAISWSGKGTLRFYNEELASEISPASGTVFVKFPITGSSCALKKASNELTGSLSCGLPEAGVSKVEHQLACNPHEGEASLKFNGEAATLESTEALKLTGTAAGKKWSAV
jgi:hypothetical protein